jgi:hypothetical protein
MHQVKKETNTMTREKLLDNLFDLNPICKSRGFWTTKNGEQIPIDQITDFHLQNIVNHCQKVRDAKIHALKQRRENKTDFYHGVFSMGEDPCDDSPFADNEWDLFNC